MCDGARRVACFASNAVAGSTSCGRGYYTSAFGSAIWLQKYSAVLATALRSLLEICTLLLMESLFGLLGCSEILAVENEREVTVKKHVENGPNSAGASNKLRERFDSPRGSLPYYYGML